MIASIDNLKVIKIRNKKKIKNKNEKELMNEKILKIMKIHNCSYHIACLVYNNKV